NMWKRAAILVLCSVALIPLPGRAESVSEDEKVLRSAGVGSDGPSLLNFFRKRTLTEPDEQKLQALIQQLGRRSFPMRESASQELIRWGRPALPFTRAALPHRDIEVARRAQRCLDEIEQGPGPELPAAAARMLARRAPEGAVAVLVAYVPNADNETVEEAV